MFPGGKARVVMVGGKETIWEGWKGKARKATCKRWYTGGYIGEKEGTGDNMGEVEEADSGGCTREVEEVAQGDSMGEVEEVETGGYMGKDG